jgi:hypothetical protein
MVCWPAGWLVDDGLTVVKAGELLARRGAAVPERTLHRYALEVLGVGRSARRTTVRVADGEPGAELQIDFGRMGLIDDPGSGRRRVAQALIFTAVFSRHCFVWLSFTQTTEAVIAGCEAAWAFFGGIFKVLIPDNMSSVVDKADPIEPRFNQCLVCGPRPTSGKLSEAQPLLIGGVRRRRLLLQVPPPTL